MVLRLWISLVFSVAILSTTFMMLKTSAITTSVPVLHQQDSTRGRELFEKYCTQCHRLDTEKKGPRLRGVFGRKVGSVPTFSYSEALKKADVTWDANSLNQWLTDPDKFIPDNNMDFQLQDADGRAAVIAYLKTLSN